MNIRVTSQAGARMNKDQGEWGEMEYPAYVFRPYQY